MTALPRRRSRAEVYAAVAAATGPAVGLPAPQSVRLHGVDGRWPSDRVTLTFDTGTTAAVDAWLAWLVSVGVRPSGEFGVGRVYPAAGACFRVYRAEVEAWSGWRVVLQCRVSARPPAGVS